MQRFGLKSEGKQEQLPPVSYNFQNELRPVMRRTDDKRYGNQPHPLVAMQRRKTGLKQSIENATKHFIWALFPSQTGIEFEQFS